VAKASAPGRASVHRHALMQVLPGVFVPLGVGLMIGGEVHDRLWMYVLGFMLVSYGVRCLVELANWKG
jgi:putative effector of murein hydrolase LrgA (UPF0299 family)